MSSLAKAFEENKYAVVRSLVTEPLLSSLRKYALKRIEMLPTETEKMNEDTDAAPTPGAYGDPMMDTLLANLTPEVERVTGLDLYPTFSFYRHYRRGDSLKKHKDRPACEIGVTLNVAYKGEGEWPLWIESARGAVEVRLGLGDAAVYRGIDCPHWRGALPGDECIQVFLFYVDQNGPYAEFKYDKRDSLSSFLPSRAGQQHRVTGGGDSAPQT